MTELNCGLLFLMCLRNETKMNIHYVALGFKAKGVNTYAACTSEETGKTKGKLTSFPRLNWLNQEPGSSLGHEDILTCQNKIQQFYYEFMIRSEIITVCCIKQNSALKTGAKEKYCFIHLHDFMSNDSVVWFIFV